MSFAFILNRINLLDIEEYHFNNNYRLIRANKEQVDIIKVCLPKTKAAISSFDRYKYDNKYELLGENEWLFWVIEQDNSIQIDQDFYYALKLSTLDIETLFEVLDIGGAIGNESQRTYNLLLRDRFNFQIQSVRSGNLSEVDYLHGKIKEISFSHKNVYRAINEFYDLSIIPIASEFYLVCILSILESLLVHYDKSNNNDKISIQLCEKLTYINDCLNESKLVYKNFFKGPDVPFETLIGKIYKYRSDIAHGNKRDFGNKLQVLNSKEKVFKFAYQLVKAVVNYSINYPDVVSKLKEKSRIS